VETWKAIDTVRVVRKFSDAPIEPQHLDRILNAGRRTGSSKNDQHWAFIVVRDRDHLAELAHVGHYAGHLAGATVAIALVTPNATGHYNNSVMWDSGRAAQNMVLAAWDLGIGSVPATVYDHELVHRLLSLPDDRRCDFLLSFGHPADPEKLIAPKRAGGRLPLSDLVHEERW
jgi:nitroreductase